MLKKLSQHIPQWYRGGDIGVYRANIVPFGLRLTYFLYEYTLCTGHKSGIESAIVFQEWDYGTMGIRDTVTYRTLGGGVW